MPFHRCTISLENGNVVARDVHLALEETDPDGGQDWYGTITATDVMMLAAGQRYRLTLDDKRSGAFLVRRNTSAGDTGRAIAIRGMGPLK